MQDSQHGFRVNKVRNAAVMNFKQKRRKRKKMTERRGSEAGGRKIKGRGRKMQH